MSIIELPASLRPTPFACVICQVGLSLDKATVGLPKADRTAGLACISHFWEVELLIVGWADFIAGERRAYERLHSSPADLMYSEGENVRFDS